MFITSQNPPPVFDYMTLVMPAVAVGNVGQLAVDLLISTLSLPRVGYLHTDCVIPMAGNNPYAHGQDDAGELHTASEVYAAFELNLAVLQIRAPVVKSKSKRFRQLLLSWIKASGFCRTLVLSSSHAYRRDDRQLRGYLVTPSLLRISGDAFEELGWRELERRLDAGADETKLAIPGGGITKGLYTDSCREDVPLAVLLLFCSEGDNVPDALSLVSHLDDMLHLLNHAMWEVKWKIPPSWNLLFGSGIPPAIF
ncbi:proteasome assembly chaperone 2 isoform X2 [Hippocampus zosterae]|uniref:proteasome assembly chaperone 2 isoform X2 n=1 Tax=Hippocampus zosterae TaxID=109293 RepID=UPI00223E063B|nr:proteasome assembly chaperone 2 isoform X2 [Hippocampus zosterae]